MKISFKRVNFLGESKFHLKLKSLDEEWRDTKSKLFEVQCEVSTLWSDLLCHATGNVF